MSYLNSRGRPSLEGAKSLITRSNHPVTVAATHVDVSEHGTLRIFDAGFAGRPAGATARLFFERAFSLPFVERVVVDARDRKAEIRFTPSASGINRQLREISQTLSGAIPPQRPVTLAEAFGLGTPTRTQMQRYGTHLSTWVVRHEMPGRIRFENPILRRRAALHQAIENDLVNAFGVDKFTIQELTGTVLVQYNQKHIQKRHIVDLLDAALAKTDDFSLSKVDYDLPVSVTAVVLAAFTTLIAPALAPLSAAVLLYSVIPTFQGAYDVVVKEKRLGVDLLDAVVVAACLATNQVLAGSILGLSLSVARKLVEHTERNSKRMLLSVFGKQARFVWLEVDGTVVETSLHQIKTGDIIVIHTGESVPVDGEVVDGMGMVDQHALTGESAPVEKVKGDKVFAATTMIAGKVRVAVTCAGEETTAAKLAQILNETSGYTLKAQSWAVQLADSAVLPTLALGALTLATRGVNPAVAVVNCDLGTGIRMAAPIAMLSTLNLAAQQGILVKSGRALERLREVDTFLFDKTGTLTRERPEVGRILTYDRYDETRILSWAAAAENKFSHPIAKAILDRFHHLNLPMPDTDETKYAVGYGVSVGVDGHIVRVGSARYLRHEGIKLPPELDHEVERVHDEGNSMILVGVDNALGGALELRAAERNEAQDVISGLRERGARHLAIISGDHQRPTERLARKLGMDRYFAEVLPQDKAQYVKTLQEEGRRVCFIGDGVNDSIALKQADVSISLRGASSIATDTAEIVFMEESLEKLLQVRDISTELHRNTRNSWYMIVGTNAVCIAGALFSNFGVMHSMVFNQVGGLAAVANGLLPLRKAAKIQAEREKLALLLSEHGVQDF